MTTLTLTVPCFPSFQQTITRSTDDGKKSPYDPAHCGVVAAASSAGAVFGFDTTLIPRITHALRCIARSILTLLHPSLRLLCDGPCGTSLEALAGSPRRPRRRPQPAASRRLAARHAGAARMSRANSAFDVHRCHAHRHRCTLGCSLRCTSRGLRPQIDAARSSVYASRYRGRWRPANGRLFLRVAVPKPSVLVRLSDVFFERSAPPIPRQHGTPDFECADRRRLSTDHRALDGRTIRILRRHDGAAIHRRVFSCGTRGVALACIRDPRRAASRGGAPQYVNPGAARKAAPSD
jgi:hypothetical protein